MREVTDNALQRLYWACRGGTGFPGQVPDESQSPVTTSDILKGLCVVKPDFDEFNLPRNTDQAIYTANAASEKDPPFQVIKPRDEEELDDGGSTASMHSSCHRSRSVSATHNLEINMKEQFAVFLPGTKPVLADRRMKLSIWRQEMDIWRLFSSCWHGRM